MKEQTKKWGEQLEELIRRVREALTPQVEQPQLVPIPVPVPASNRRPRR
ncbi:MAG: hypothetical protein H7095_03745 [Pseudopedobacter sp.]|nr:hypothetical protein [Deinococcales bacterium]